MNASTEKERHFTDSESDNQTHSGESLSKPTVSVVIPAYNAEATIVRALDSVYAQTYDNIIEVIVVDDGSRDGTVEAVKTVYPQVILVQQENSGNAAARNTGVYRASGQLIAFLDADDEWLPDKLLVQVEALRRHPGLSLVTCQFNIVANDGYPGYRENIASTGYNAPSVTMSTFRDWAFRSSPHTRFSGCSGWLFKRDMYITVGGLCESLHRSPDWEFLLRITGQGHTVGVVPGQLVRYYVRHNSVSNSPKGRLEIANIVIDIIKNYDPARDSWEGDMLTNTEYNECLSRLYFGYGWVFFELGEYEQARGYLRAASKLSDSTGTQAIRKRLAAWSPRLYRILSKLRRLVLA